MTEGSFIVTLRSVRLGSHAPMPPKCDNNSVVWPVSDAPSNVWAFASQRQKATDPPLTSDSSTNQIACLEIT